MWLPNPTSGPYTLGPDSKPQEQLQFKLKTKQPIDDAVILITSRSFRRKK